jgi:hypothetical protein
MVKVVCINNTNGNGVKLDLTIYKVYNVYIIKDKLYDDCYYYKDDKGVSCIALRKRFILLSEYRRMKLKKLNYIR